MNNRVAWGAAGAAAGGLAVYWASRSRPTYTDGMGCEVVCSAGQGADFAWPILRPITIQTIQVSVAFALRNTAGGGFTEMLFRGAVVSNPPQYSGSQGYQDLTTSRRFGTIQTHNPNSGPSLFYDSHGLGGILWNVILKSWSAKDGSGGSANETFVVFPRVHCHPNQWIVAHMDYAGPNVVDAETQLMITSR